MIEGRDWIGWVSVAEEARLVSFNEFRPVNLTEKLGWKTKRVRITLPESLFSETVSCEAHVIATEDEK